MRLGGEGERATGVGVLGDGDGGHLRIVAHATVRPAAVADGASYQTLNAAHLSIHLSLVGLTGSPRLVAMAESVVAELRLALAQIDRVRRNARDQAGSHHHLLDLLEAGDIDAATAELEQHLDGAEDAIIERLDLG